MIEYETYTAPQGNSEETYYQDIGIDTDLRTGELQKRLDPLAYPQPGIRQRTANPFGDYTDVPLGVDLLTVHTGWVQDTLFTLPFLGVEGGVSGGDGNAGYNLPDLGLSDFDVTFNVVPNDTWGGGAFALCFGGVASDVFQSLVNGFTFGVNGSPGSLSAQLVEVSPDYAGDPIITIESLGAATTFSTMRAQKHGNVVTLSVDGNLVISKALDKTPAGPQMGFVSGGFAVTVASASAVPYAS